MANEEVLTWDLATVGAHAYWALAPDGREFHHQCSGPECRGGEEFAAFLADVERAAPPSEET